MSWIKFSWNQKILEIVRKFCKLPRLSKKTQKTIICVKETSRSFQLPLDPKAQHRRKLEETPRVTIKRVEKIMNENVTSFYYERIAGFGCATLKSFQASRSQQRRVRIVLSSLCDWRLVSDVVCQWLSSLRISFLPFANNFERFFSILQFVFFTSNQFLIFKIKFFKFPLKTQILNVFAFNLLCPAQTLNW